MACPHRHVVVHRNDKARHRYGADAESDCECGPALLCPICMFATMESGCAVSAPPSLVESLRRNGLHAESVH
jgi:hypothetical protein